MPVTAEVTTLEENRVRLDVAVPEDEVRRSMDRAVKEMGRRMRVPGFRPGRIPPQVILQRLGREAVMQQVLESSLGSWYAEALRAAGVDPIDEPKVDLGEASESGVGFTAEVQLAPTPVLGDYRGLEVGRAVPEVPEEAVEAELARLTEQAARLEDVERPGGQGDFMVIDYDASLDGQPLVEASTRDFLVELGGPRLVAEFDTALRGASAGDVRPVSVSYGPDDPREPLRGLTVDYEVTVKRVQRKVLPARDDALAREVSEFDTFAELEADVRARLLSAAERLVQERYRRAVIDAATANATLDVPEVMVRRRVEEVLAETARQLPRGITLQQYVEAQGSTLERSRQDMRPDAELSIRRELVVAAIMEAEGIEVSDEELEQRVRSDAVAADRDPDELLARIREAGADETLRRDIRVQKAVDLIVAESTPISLQDEIARERIWTPEKEQAPAPAKLWTPGDPTPPTPPTGGRS
jgi:trigger factor